MSADGELSDFIIDEDKDAVGDGAEPPGDPVESKSWSVGQRERGQRKQV